MKENSNKTRTRLVCWKLHNANNRKDVNKWRDMPEIKSVNPKGNQSWIFTGRTDAEAEAPILPPPDAKNWLIGKDPDAGKDWRQEKGTTEDEMIGWHHRLDGHEFEQALGVGDGQGSLASCSPWGPKESHTTDWLNWTALFMNWKIQHSKDFSSPQIDIQALYNSHQQPSNFF